MIYNKQHKLSIRSLFGLLLLALVSTQSVAYEVFSQGAYVKATPTAEANEFGRAMAVAGNTMVVGAPNEDAHKGAIYIFTSTDDGVSWAQQVRLTAANGAAGDQFGMSVAISEDTSTIIVGAPIANSEAGVAYIFVGSAASWTETVLAVSGGGVSAGDYLGWSVAVSGDVAIVGAPGTNANAGAAYHFVRGGSVWTSANNFKAGAAAGDNVGSAVGISAGRAAVGAYGVNGEAGEVYAFTHNGGGGFFADASFPVSSAAVGDWFGQSVAVVGDQIVVGVPRASSKRGAAYVFTHATGGGWTQAQLTASSAAYDFFGTDVTINGSLIVVGAPGSDLHKGAAYVFQNAGNGWQSKIMRAQNKDAYDFFGNAVAVTTDESVLVAAFGEASNGTAADNSKNHAGALYTFQSETLANVPGDENGDGLVEIIDVIAVINLVLNGSPPVNGSDCILDNTMTIDDVVCTINATLQ